MCFSTIGKFTFQTGSTRTDLKFPKTSREPSPNTKEFCTAKDTTTMKLETKIWKHFLLNFFTRRMKLLRRPDDFMLYGKLGVDFFYTCESLIMNMNFRLRLIKARAMFHRISDNPDVSLGIVHFSFCNLGFVLKDEFQKKRYVCIKSCGVQLFGNCNHDFYHSCKTRRNLSRTLFSDAPVRQIVVSMLTCSAFNGSFAENTFWYQNVYLGQFKKRRGTQPNVNFEAVGNCRPYNTTMKALNFQVEIRSILINVFNEHFVLVFYSMQDATENCHYPELVGESLTLELNFNFYLEHVTELIALGERRYLVAVDNFGFYGWKM